MEDLKILLDRANRIYYCGGDPGLIMKQIDGEVWKVKHKPTIFGRDGKPIPIAGEGDGWTDSLGDALCLVQVLCRMGYGVLIELEGKGRWRVYYERRCL